MRKWLSTSRLLRYQHFPWQSLLSEPPRAAPTRQPSAGSTALRRAVDRVFMRIVRQAQLESQASGANRSSSVRNDRNPASGAVDAKKAESNRSGTFAA